MKYHFTHTSMATIINKGQIITSIDEDVWRDRNPHTLLVSMQSGAVALKKGLADPQKVKHKVTRGTSSPKYIFKKIKNISHKNLYATVYPSIIQNSQKIEITQCPSTDKRNNKM